MRIRSHLESFSLLVNIAWEEKWSRAYPEGRTYQECFGGEKSFRVMSTKVEIEGVMMDVSAYAPVGCEMGEKEEFWSDGECTQGRESGDWSEFHWVCW